MQPVNFEGAKEYKKPESMTDEECMSAYAAHVHDEEGRCIFVTAWQPSYEDIQAINRGEPIFLQMMIPVLIPHALYTLDENKKPNV